MRRGSRFLWVLSLPLMAGCSGSELTLVNSAAPVELVSAPSSLEPSDLVLFGPAGQLHVGDTLEAAERAFPTPATSFAIRELPPGFAPPYKARGYETANGGFAALLYGDRIAVAMRRDEDIEDGRLVEVVERYLSARSTSAQFVDGVIKYWFWYRQGQRVMVCATPDPKSPSRFDVTVALGDASTMNALRMSPTDAPNDLKIGEELLARQSRGVRK